MEAGALAAAVRARASRGQLAFAGLVGAAFLNFLAIGAVIPVLPRYVKGPIAAGDVSVGVVVGAFAVAAIVARPLAGRAADRRGRRVVMVAGAALSSIAGALLFVPAGVPGLVAARLLLGFGEGAVFTAGATWSVDLAPPGRRGRTIGLFGLAVWSGLAIGAPVGEGLNAVGGYPLVWGFAALAPLLSALAASRLRDARRAAPPPGARAPLVPRAAVRPGLSLFMANFGYAAVAGFLVLHLDARGIGDGAGVFTAFAAAVVGARLALGNLPDRIGPKRSAPLAGTLEVAGLAAIAAAHSLPVAIAGAVAMGTGFSLLYPSLALVVIARSRETERGAALGAFTAFFDAGVGLGGPVVGGAVAIGSYPWAFWVAAALAAVGVGLAATNRAARGVEHAGLAGPEPV